MTRAEAEQEIAKPTREARCLHAQLHILYCELFEGEDPKCPENILVPADIQSLGLFRAALERIRQLKGEQG